MDITTARVYVREVCRNAGDSTMYSDTAVDHAIQAAADHFIRFTRYTRQVSNLTITATSADVTLSITGFHPERVIRAWIPAVGELEVIGLSRWLDLSVNDPRTGDPTTIAFTSTTAASLWPTPETSVTGKMMWFPPFTTWTAGTSDVTTLATTLNIADDDLREILYLGSPHYLQGNEPEHRYAAERWQQFQDYVARRSSAGNLGDRLIHRVTLRDLTTSTEV